MRGGSRSESSSRPNWSPERRASVSCGFKMRPRRRASVSRIESPTAMPTELFTCLKRSRSITITVGRMVESALAKESAASSRSRNSSRFGRPVRLSCTASCSSRSSAVLNSVTSVTRADEAHHLAVGADHGPRLQRKPHVMAVERAQAEFQEQPPAALVEHAVERRAEAVAVERMQHFEPVGGRAAQRAALQAEHRLGLGRGEHPVVRHVPVPDHVARAGQGERPSLDVGDDRNRSAAREGMLHDGEADQHHDQHEAAEQRRSDDVVGDDAGDGEASPRTPTRPAAARSGSAAPRGRSRGPRDRRRGRGPRSPRWRAKCARRRRRPPD